MKPDSADRDDERPRTVSEAVSDHLYAAALADARGEMFHEAVWRGSAHWWGTAALDALGLDPATVLAGPVVVLHPGQHVVESRPPLLTEDFVVSGDPDCRKWALVASGPEVAT